MESQLSLSGKNFPGITSKDSGEFTAQKHWSWEIWRQTQLHAYVQRHWWEQEKLWRRMHFTFRRNQRVREEILARTLGGPWTRRGRKMVWWIYVKAQRKWNSVAKHMHQRFEETGHPIFKGVSAMNRGVKKRRTNKCTIHLTAETSNVELLFQLICSANQFSIYGAVATWSGQHGPKETELISEKFVKSEESVNTETLKSVHSHKKWILWWTRRGPCEPLETECKMIFRT